jgi:hypothetical protein
VRRQKRESDIPTFIVGIEPCAPSGKLDFSGSKMVMELKSMDFTLRPPSGEGALK